MLETAPKEEIEPTQDSFADGCTWHAVAGAFFIGAIIMPGSIYMGLIAGVQMGAAAEWVTIILFAEIARRSFKTITKQEVYVIYYIAGGMTAVLGGLVLAGGPVATLIWHQYLAQSQVGQAFQTVLGDGSTVPLIERFPTWIVPDLGTEEGMAALVGRNLLARPWWPAIAVVVISTVLSRMSWFGMGYTLFRLTSDVERLEFPLAPVAAEGATALAENVSGEESWRWSVFSVGMMIGLLFGVVYVGLPSLSGIIMVRPITLLP
ncbi:MAG: peptide transporter, partial [Candidatus Latescibacteria bacterium]|nr:peptide transporter [Candidatus Latescibacterota bacterium]